MPSYFSHKSGCRLYESVQKVARFPPFLFIARSQPGV
jgi:hypothetical protein